MARGLRRPTTTGLVLLGCLGLAFLVFLPAWLHPTGSLIGDGTDGSQFTWFLGWFPFALGHGRNPFVTDFLHYPAGANLMWNTSIPLAGTLLGPVTLLLGPVFAYNLVETLAVALSAWTGFLFIRRYAPAPGAVIGGVVYGFSPYMMAQSLGHPHMTLAFLPPLIFLALDELLIRREQPSVWLSILLGIMGAAQLLLSEELLLTTAIVAVWGGCLLALLDPAQARRRAIPTARALAPAAVVFVLLSAVPVGVQFLGPQQVQGLFHGRDSYVGDLLGFVVPTRMQWLAPPIATQISVRFPGNFSERDSYVGLPMILVLIWAVRRWWHEMPVRVAAILALLVSLFSLGRTFHLAGLDTTVPVVLAVVPLALWTQLGRARAMALVFGVTWAAWILIPAAGDILPDRLMLYVYLLAGIPLAYLINDVLRRRSWRRIGGVAMALTALAPLLPVVPYPNLSIPIPAFFTAEVDNIVPADSVALVTTTLGPFHSPMVWQAVARMRFKMPGGYVFVPGPAGPTLNPPTTVVSEVVDSIQNGRAPAYTEELRTRLSAQLRAWQVQTVIVGPGNGRTGLIALFNWLLGRGPALRGGVAVWANVAAELTTPTSQP